MIHTTVLITPIGPLALLEHDGALVGAGFTADPTDLHARLHPTLRTHELMRVADLGALSKAHEAYLDGDLEALDVLTVHQPGTPTRERLWAELRKVPAGHTVTYGELAEQAGVPRGARVAGQACSQNLVAPAIPCHRVVAAGAGGKRRLNGYLYGLDRKSWLLSHENTHAPTAR